MTRIIAMTMMMTKKIKMTMTMTMMMMMKNLIGWPYDSCDSVFFTKPVIFVNTSL